jgi:hypothetical protein
MLVDLTIIAGSLEKFVGKLQERFGLQKEEAQKPADEGLMRATASWKTILVSSRRFPLPAPVL